MFKKLIFVSVVTLQTLLAVAQMQLNASFGNNGVVKISLDDFTEPVSVLKLNNDSLLLLANVTHNDTSIKTDFALIKLTPDGAVNLSFGQNGNVRYDFNGMDISNANSLLVLDDEKILVLGSGHVQNNTSFIPACLMKLFADGKIDSAFGTNGTLNLQFDGIEEFPRVLKKAAGGKIIIGGFSTDSSHTHADVPAIARMNQNGTLDSSFGFNGKAYLRFPNGIISAKRHTIGGVLYDILELSNGTYLASGGYSNGLNLMGFIAHLNHDGSVDTTFFMKGYLGIDFTPFANSQIIKMKQDANGLIWFGATSTSLQGKDFFTGNLNLTTSDYNVGNIDFNGNEDAVADIQFGADGNLFFIGKTILPQHTSPAYQSDYFAVDFSPTSTFPFNSQHFIFSEDSTMQTGAVSSILQTNGNLICYGFKRKPSGENELMVIAINTNLISSVKEDVEQKNSLEVFPNPAHDKIFIHLKQNELLNEVSVYDVTGREIISEKNNFSSLISIDVSNLNTGIYLLRVKSNKATFVTKVVVQ